MMFSGRPSDVPKIGTGLADGFVSVESVNGRIVFEGLIIDPPGEETSDATGKMDSKTLPDEPVGRTMISGKPPVEATAFGTNCEFETPEGEIGTTTSGVSSVETPNEGDS